MSGYAFIEDSDDEGDADQAKEVSNSHNIVEDSSDGEDDEENSDDELDHGAQSEDDEEEEAPAPVKKSRKITVKRSTDKKA